MYKMASKLFISMTLLVMLLVVSTGCGNSSEGTARTMSIFRVDGDIVRVAGGAGGRLTQEAGRGFLRVMPYLQAGLRFATYGWILPPL